MKKIAIRKVLSNYHIVVLVMQQFVDITNVFMLQLGKSIKLIQQYLLLIFGSVDFGFWYDFYSTLIFFVLVLGEVDLAICSLSDLFNELIPLRDVINLL